MFKSREAKPAYDRRYRAENREKINHRQREAKKAKNHEQSRQWKRDHPEYATSYAKRTYHETRQRLYGFLGLVCVGCGHSDLRVLEFDHINDDGAIDRKRFSGARSMLDYYVRNPEEACEKLQVLCRNCNWLKRKGYEWRTAKAGGDELDGQRWHEFPAGMANHCKPEGGTCMNIHPLVERGTNSTLGSSARDAAQVCACGDGQACHRTTVAKLIQDALPVPVLCWEGRAR